MLTLAEGHSHIKIKTGFSQNSSGRFEPNFVRKFSGIRK